MDPKIIDKVLSKNASPEEARQVAKWFSTKEGQEYFAQRFDRESYLMNEKIIAEWLDHDIPSNKMQKRFLVPLRMRVRTFRFKFAAAVLIPFIFLVGAFTYITFRTGAFESNDMAEIVVPFGEQMNVVLQDGTMVQLNSGSRLEYPKSFGILNRKVKLTGEGYFSVAKEVLRPFEVDLSEIKVKVTGTHFNVWAYSEDKKIRVSLEEGSVNIIDKVNNLYPLKVGQSAEYDRESGKCKISKMNDINLYTAWRTKSLNFYRTPLKEIIKTLERQYEVKFEVKDSSLLAYKFSISTSKININEIINDLEKVSKIKFVKKNENNFIISTMN